MATKTQQPSLVDLLNKATAADLADIDQQIADKQSELDEATKQLITDLESLKAVRKVIDIRVNGKPARKKREPRKAAGDKGVSQSAASAPASSDLLARIIQIIHGCGPCTSYTISKKLGDTSEYLVRNALIKSKDKFTRNDDGTWELFV